MRSTALIQAAKCWLDAALSFFYPEVCQICYAERATVQDGYVCKPCSSPPGGIRFITAPFCVKCGLPYAGQITTSFECSNCREIQLSFHWARASVVADGLVREVVHRYKYNRALWFEPFFNDLLRRTAAPQLRQEHWDMIVPVPLHPLKKREREFNQSERLGLILSGLTDIPLNSRLLRRVEYTRTQTALRRSERASNVRSAFRAGPDSCLRDRRILLFDDVLTTGATADACSKALLAAGASEVCVWTLSRAVGHT